MALGHLKPFGAVGCEVHGGYESGVGGLLVADLVTVVHSNNRNIPESDFRLSRFDEGQLLTARFPCIGACEKR